MSSRKPCVLTIGGSDSSCGAGIQADLKAISSQGCYGLTVLTCVVAEVPGQVGEIKSLSTSLITRQIELLFETFPIQAVKTGLLYSPLIVRAVAQMLKYFISDRKFPVVVDPVMIASAGTALVTSDISMAYEKYLAPLSTVMTPNLDELSTFVGQSIVSYPKMKHAGHRLVKKWGISLLLKGGHLGGKMARDVLITPSGGEREYTSAFLPNGSLHGTGCTFSAAIASRLALGNPLEQAIEIAKSYMDRTIRSHLIWDKIRALEHFPNN